MNSQVSLSPSVTQRYKPGEWLQITPDQTISIVTDPKEQNLPELLQAVPSLLEQLSATSQNTISIQERRHLHDRLVLLDSQVIEYNKETESNFWITLLHVLLLILTFGGFNYRNTWLLEEPKISLASLLPESFDPKTLDRSLDELLETREENLSSLQDPNQVVGLPVPSLLRLQSLDPASPLKGPAKQEFSQLSGTEITTALKLDTLSEYTIVELRPPLLIEAFHLMNEKQWRGLSRGIFLLAIRAITREGKEMQITNQTVRELFLSHGLLKELPFLLLREEENYAPLLKQLMPLTVEELQPLLTEMSSTTLPLEPWSQIAEVLLPEHLVWFFLEKRLPDQTELERKKIESLLTEISKRELPQDHAMLFSLLSGINSYLEKEAVDSPYKKALLEFSKRVWDAHTAIFSAPFSFNRFEQSINSLAESGQKERFTQLLTENEEVFMKRVNEANLRTQEQILTQLIDPPQTIIPGSPQGKLVTAIGKRFPNLVKLWREGRGTIQN